jgi:GNAT superfamily N-acetyltransferase
VTPIRPATAAEVPALRSIAVAAGPGYVPRIGRQPAPMTADYRAPAHHGQAWAATKDGQAAGCIIRIPQPAHVPGQNVAVLPAARGMGAQLLALAEDRARSRRLPQVRPCTNEAMTENLASYLRHGHTQTHRAQQDGFHRVHFRKRLDS